MALPPVAAPALTLSESDLDPLALPDDLPEGVVPNVPLPKEDYPEWTTAPFSLLNIPQTFPRFIELPKDPRLHPALYAAAIDTMRMTNDYFYEKEGIDRNSLTEEQVEEIQNLDYTTFPRPPDLRTMLVEENVEDDANILWLEAHTEVRKMPVMQWEHRLTNTRDDVEMMALRGNDIDGQQNLRGLFVRYLVWHEFVAGTTYRSRRIQEDEQPDLEQLNLFFHQILKPANGVKLADICHAFPRARDIRKLVYRIERCATLRTYPDRDRGGGVLEPVENKYIPKPNPTQGDLDRIQDTVEQEGFAKLFGLANPYFPSVANVGLITAALGEVAVPDSTGRRFFARATIDLAEAGDHNYIHGVTFEELRERFTQRGWDLGWFPVWLEEFMYFDAEEDRHFTRYLLPDSDIRTTREGSILERNSRRVELTWDPRTIQDTFRWDRDRVRYVRREPPVVEDLAAAAGEDAAAAGEDAAAAREDAAAAREDAAAAREDAAAAREDAAAAREEDAAAREEDAAAREDAAAAREDAAAVREDAAAAREDAAAAREDAAGGAAGEDAAGGAAGEDAAGGAAGEDAASEAGPGGRTRGAAKRPAPGPPRPTRAAKQARRGGIVQCSRRTRANNRCARTKNGERDEEWDCGLHGRRRH
jgi:hypothetical protein